MSPFVDTAAVRAAGDQQHPFEFYPFDHPNSVPAKELARVLGGKGAALAETTRALGFAVPPGFAIPLGVSNDFQRKGRLPGQLASLLERHVKRLGETIGRRLGDRRDPLLLTLRSGATVSMPGMLDTVLNLGRHCHAPSGLRHSRQPVGQEDDHNQLCRIPVLARGHSPSDMALPPLHPQPARRRRFVGGTRSGGVLRDSSALGESSADAAAGTQDAAVQERRLRAEIPLEPCRRLQHLQPETPSYFSPSAPRATRRGDGYVADRSSNCLTIAQAPTLRVRRAAT